MDPEKAIEFLLEQQAKHDAHVAKNDQQIGQILEIANKLVIITAGVLEHARIADRRLDALENRSLALLLVYAAALISWPAPSGISCSVASIFSHNAALMASLTVMGTSGSS